MHRLTLTGLIALGGVCQVVEKPERVIVQPLIALSNVHAACFTRSISCHPSIFRIFT